ANGAVFEPVVDVVAHDAMCGEHEWHFRPADPPSLDCIPDRPFGSWSNEDDGGGAEVATGDAGGQSVGGGGDAGVGVAAAELVEGGRDIAGRELDANTGMLASEFAEEFGDDALGGGDGAVDVQRPSERSLLVDPLTVVAEPFLEHRERVAPEPVPCRSE